MPLVTLSVQHGYTLEEARRRLETAVAELTSRFGTLVRRVEWSADRTQVRLERSLDRAAARGARRARGRGHPCARTVPRWLRYHAAARDSPTHLSATTAGRQGGRKVGTLRRLCQFVCHPHCVSKLRHEYTSYH
jgi:hypothetical protein